MLKPKLSKWQNLEETQGLLFFAQCLEELLFHHTLDTFKAPALNTKSRALELFSLSIDYKNNRIRKGALNHVIQELEWSIKNDAVFKPTMPTIFKVFLSDLKNPNITAEQLYSEAKAFFFELERFYWIKLKENIESKVAEEKHKKDILNLATSFTAEIELRGFSRDYLYNLVKTFFFNEYFEPHIISTPNQIKDFLTIFDRDYREWIVVLRVPQNYREFMDLASQFSVEMKLKPPALRSAGYKENMFLGKNDKYPIYLNVKVKAKDNHSALKRALLNLDKFFDILCFYDHKLEMESQKIGLVIDNETQDGKLLKIPPDPMKCGSHIRIVESTEGIDRTLNILQEEYLHSSSEWNFVNLFNYHRSALESKTPENQLVNLWTAIEGFLPSPSENMDRIIFYVDALLPSLTLTYPERIFRYISDNLYHGGLGVREFINSQVEGDDFFEKSIRILVLHDLVEARKKLFSKLDNHPLLRFRCFFYNVNYGSTNRVRASIISHRKKISWHIMRIYSTRNQIMHSAKALPYLITLVENLHSYLDIFLDSFTRIIEFSKTNDIDSAIKLISLYEKGFLDDLETDDQICTPDNYKEIIFGGRNPLSPFFNG